MLTIRQAAKLLRLSEIRVKQLCQSGRIVGAHKFGFVWAIPDKLIINPPLKIKHRRKRGKK